MKTPEGLVGVKTRPEVSPDCTRKRLRVPPLRKRVDKVTGNKLGSSLRNDPNRLIRQDKFIQNGKRVCVPTQGIE